MTLAVFDAFTLIELSGADLKNFTSRASPLNMVLQVSIYKDIFVKPTLFLMS